MRGIWVKSFDQTEEAFVVPDLIVMIVPLTKTTDPKPIGSRVYFGAGSFYDFAPTPRELVALFDLAEEHQNRAKGTS